MGPSCAAVSEQLFLSRAVTLMNLMKTTVHEFLLILLMLALYIHSLLYVFLIEKQMIGDITKFPVSCNSN